MDNKSILLSFPSFATQYPQIVHELSLLTQRAAFMPQKQYSDDTLVFYTGFDAEWIVDALLSSDSCDYRRLLIIVPSHAVFRFFDHRVQQSVQARAALSNIELVLFENASCTYHQHLDYDHLTQERYSICFLIGSYAQLQMISLYGGGGDIHAVVEAHLLGPGAQSCISSTIVAALDQKITIQTYQYHSVQGASSKVTLKGVVCDRAVVALEGLINIAPLASRSEAFLEHGVIRLNALSVVHSKPILEIANNDVCCSHASAIGNIDPMHLWYLIARGISLSTARKLLVQSYIGVHSIFKKEIIKKIESLDFV